MPPVIPVEVFGITQRKEKQVLKKRVSVPAQYVKQYHHCSIIGCGLEKKKKTIWKREKGG